MALIQPSQSNTATTYTSVALDEKERKARRDALLKKMQSGEITQESLFGSTKTDTGATTPTASTATSTGVTGQSALFSKAKEDAAAKAAEEAAAAAKAATAAAAASSTGIKQAAGETYEAETSTENRNIFGDNEKANEAANDVLDSYQSITDSKTTYQDSLKDKMLESAKAMYDVDKQAYNDLVDMYNEMLDNIESTREELLASAAEQKDLLDILAGRDKGQQSAALMNSLRNMGVDVDNPLILGNMVSRINSQYFNKVQQAAADYNENKANIISQMDALVRGVKDKIGIANFDQSQAQKSYEETKAQILENWITGTAEAEQIPLTRLSEIQDKQLAQVLADQAAIQDFGEMSQQDRITAVISALTTIVDPEDFSMTELARIVAEKVKLGEASGWDMADVIMETAKALDPNYTPETTAATTTPTAEATTAATTTSPNQSSSASLVEKVFNNIPKGTYAIQNNPENYYKLMLNYVEMADRIRAKGISDDEIISMLTKSLENTLSKRQ